MSSCPIGLLNLQLSDSSRKFTTESGQGRLDIAENEWFICDPYPNTWFRFRDEKIVITDQNTPSWGLGDDDSVVLGQKVYFAKPLIRSTRRKQINDSYTTWRVWEQSNTSDVKPGVLVGIRYLKNGKIYNYGYDDPTVFAASETFKALLISYDLNRKPVYVLPKNTSTIKYQEVVI